MAKRWSAGNKVNASDLNNSVVPTGALTLWGAAAAPTDWLLCDGASLLRASYADLFAVIGTTYGSADGTHFNVPNLKGKVPVGFNSAEAEFDALGETGGEKTHQLTVAELAAHTHSETNAAGSNGASSAGGGGLNLSNGSVGATTGSAGSGTAHNNLQPYITLNYIIKI